MGWSVVTKASGGIPVVDNTAATNKIGMPVSEAANGFGQAVTKVASGGIPVLYVTAPLLARSSKRAEKHERHL